MSSKDIRIYFLLICGCGEKMSVIFLFLKMITQKTLRNEMVKISGSNSLLKNSSSLL